MPRVQTRYVETIWMSFTWVTTPTVTGSMATLPGLVGGVIGSRRGFSLGHESVGPHHGLSSPVREALLAAGWRPGRSVDVSDTIARLTLSGYVIHENFISFVREFWGLEIRPALAAGPNFMNDEPYWVSPDRGVRYLDEALLLEDVFGENHNPVGWWLSSSHVFMGASGSVRAYLDGLVWELGETPFEALEFAVRPTRPLVCAWSSPGRRSWPKRS
ncbi:SUKH-3 domain-containing protein [Streptomyces sp. PalvLS-984]|uniref:SUKH-3 domain-containing protein n=1 Tax=Streptomyces sp. PalvLS-984 TaxID=1839782 RepID=UPI000B8419F5